ncbi:MAG TPA: GIY-YIG nuclease family protein [Methylobacter sp.]
MVKPISGIEPESAYSAPVAATYLWFVYLLECLNGKIYTGIITNIEVRFNKHLAGKGAKFTKMNPHSYLMAIKQGK